MTEEKNKTNTQIKNQVPRSWSEFPESNNFSSLLKYQEWFCFSSLDLGVLSQMMDSGDQSCLQLSKLSGDQKHICARMLGPMSQTILNIFSL